MDPLSAQYNDEENWQGTASGEEICCIQTVSVSNTGVQTFFHLLYLREMTLALISVDSRNMHPSFKVSSFHISF